MKRDRVKFRASFRLFGDSLRPALATERLGITPAHAHAKGDLQPRNRNRPYRTGTWIIDSALPFDRPLDDHVSHLLDRLEPVTEQILEFESLGCRADFLCAFDFSENTGGGVSLEAETISRMAAIHAEFSLSIYWMGKD
jgi:hypothetical protein